MRLAVDLRDRELPADLAGLRVQGDARPSPLPDASSERAGVRLAGQRRRRASSWLSPSERLRAEHATSETTTTAQLRSVSAHAPPLPSVTASIRREPARSVRSQRRREVRLEQPLDPRRVARPSSRATTRLSLTRTSVGTVVDAEPLGELGLLVDVDAGAPAAGRAPCARGARAGSPSAAPGPERARPKKTSSGRRIVRHRDRLFPAVRALRNPRPRHASTLARDVGVVLDRAGAGLGVGVRRLPRGGSRAAPRARASAVALAAAAVGAAVGFAIQDWTRRVAGAVGGALGAAARARSSAARSARRDARRDGRSWSASRRSCSPRSRSIPVVGFLEAVARAGARRSRRGAGAGGTRGCASSPATECRKKLILAVIDGLTPATLEARSRAAARPRSRCSPTHGRYGRAVSTFPSLTPVCISSIATGGHPDVHHIPHLVWYHRGERRIVEYGSSFGAIRAAGTIRSLRDTIFEMNRAHLARDAVDGVRVARGRGPAAAAINLTCYRGRTRHLPTRARACPPGATGRAGSSTTASSSRTRPARRSPCATASGGSDRRLRGRGRALARHPRRLRLPRLLPLGLRLRLARARAGRRSRRRSSAPTRRGALVEAAGGPDEFLERYAVSSAPTTARPASSARSRSRSASSGPTTSS